jgi:hypothetical protein
VTVIIGSTAYFRRTKYNDRGLVCPVSKNEDCQGKKARPQGELVLVQNLKSDKDIAATSGHLPLNHV